MEILLVEDDLGLIELVKEKIAECGFSSTSVQSGGEAISWLKINKPDLIILDFSLPDMTGKEFITELKTTEISIPPFLVSTGQGDELIAVEMMKLGARDYLIKNRFYLDKLPGVLKRIHSEIENENKRINAERELKERESNYFELFNTIQQAIYVQNPDMTFINVNQGVVDMYGYERDYFIGKTPEFLSAPGKNDLDNIAELVNLAFHGKPQRFEFWGIKKNGTVFPKDVSTVKGKYFGKDVVITVAVDVTERKRADLEREVIQEITHGITTTKNLDELLKLIHLSLSKILNAENLFISLYDAKTNLFNFPYFVDKYDSRPEPQSLEKSCTAYVFKTGKPLLFTPELFEQLAEKNEIELIGTNSLSWIGVPLYSPSKKIGVLVVQQYEEKNVYSERDVNFLDSVGGHIAIAIERKRAEDNLQNERLLLRTVIDNIPDSIYCKDILCRKTLANLTELQYAGVDSEEVILGKTDFDFYPREIAEGFYETDRTVMQTGTPILNKEEYLIDSNGEKQWLLSSKLPLKDDNGQVIGLVGVGRDITESKKAEEEIRNQNQQLKTLNSEKDKLFSIIAHDLRSPFHGLLGLTEILATDCNDMEKEDIAKYSNVLHDSVVNLYKLLENLLEWAQFQKGSISYSPKNLSLANVFDQSINSNIQRAEQKGIFIFNEIPKSLDVFADEKMLNSILRNFLSNAIKFTKKGGKVVGTAKNVNNGMIEVSITDTGIGIPENIIDKIFTIGSKISKKGTDGEPSTGLGLMLCKEFVEKHGGKIWVESKEQFGSTFYFTIPKFKNN